VDILKDRDQLAKEYKVLVLLSLSQMFGMLKQSGGWFFILGFFLFGCLFFLRSKVNELQ